MVLKNNSIEMKESVKRKIIKEN